MRSGGADLASILGQDSGPPVYSIVRRAGDGLQTIAAAEDTAVQPGDTIDVKRHGIAAPSSAIGVSDPVLSSKEN